MLSPESARSWYAASDPVHGIDHVLRVYKLAERIARAEGADLEIVGAAVLLHDARDPLEEVEKSNGGRAEHQNASATFARGVLQSEGWPEERIAAVEHCIHAHRFRGDVPPETLEARVLFDADKLDAIGAVGVARAIAFAVQAGRPVYAEPSRRFEQTGQTEAGELHSAYHEFIFKLRHLKERLYTTTGRQMAEERHRYMEDFFDRLREEAGE
jgi:uncharacterized protein